LITAACDPSIRAVGQYLYNLRDCGISSSEESFEQRSFLSVISTASTFPKQLFEGCQSVHCYGFFKAGLKNLMRELQQEIDHFKGLRKGFV
jgi:hypothetical protein